MEYGRDVPYGPASEEDIANYTKALQSGKSYFSKGHHGFELKFYVVQDNKS
jgi:hypothetical protein